MHSTFSDGKLTPSELLFHAKEAGLEAVSLTDHDSVAGIDEAWETGKNLGIKIIPGIEMNTDIPGCEIHILGYNVPFHNQEFLKELQVLKQERAHRMQRMIGNLRKIGITVYFEEVLNEAGDAPLGRPHLARVLLKNGFAFSFEDVFRKYLEKGKPGYEPHYHRLTPENVISFLKKYSAVSVIAHPGISGCSNEQINFFRLSGLDGIEAFHSRHDAEAVHRYVSLARSRKMLVTGGSDCHGEETVHGMMLGRYGLDEDGFKEFMDNLKETI